MVRPKARARALPKRYPKKPGLFGQLNTQGGGMESTQFGKRSLYPFQFSFYANSSILYESWHPSAKIWYPIEVEIVVSGGRRSGHLKRNWEQSFFRKEVKYLTFILKNELFSQFLMIRIRKKKFGIANFYHFFSTFAKKKWYHLKEGLDKKLMKFEF